MLQDLQDLNVKCLDVRMIALGKVIASMENANVISALLGIHVISKSAQMIAQTMESVIKLFVNAALTGQG